MARSQAMLDGPGELRFALKELRRRDGFVDFQDLCLALARVTVCSSFRKTTGPVSAGGDGGRDFDSFVSFEAELGELAAATKFRPGDTAVGMCTLQQDKIGNKILADVEKVAKGVKEGMTAPALVVAYCEVDVTTAERNKVEAQAQRKHGLELNVFGGSVIADLLWENREKLESAIKQYLRVSADRPQRVAPRRLPRSPQKFVNRARELATMNAELASAATRPTTSIVVLAGLPGVGKSAIAAHWANTVREQFPDGDLYLDLASRPDQPAPDVEDLLADLLRDLGVPSVAMPISLEDRRRLFEQETASRRLLMFIDNANAPAQVQAALPTGKGSLVVVASNGELEELVHDGAEPIPVKPIEGDEGRQLIAEMAGTARPDSRDANLDRLVGLCEGLPIALAACGAQLATRPYLSVAALADEIESAQDRLAALSGIQKLSTESVFETAHEALDEHLAVFYRKMWLHPGPAMVPGAAAALAATDAAHAGEQLRALQDRQLLTAIDDDRYEVHGLIRLHMRKTARRLDHQSEIDAAFERLAYWHYRCCRSADFAVQHDRLRLTDGPSETVSGGPTLRSPADAYSWFERERHNVLAVIASAEERGMFDLVWQFAEALWPLCATQKWFRAWVDSQQAGVRCAVEIGDDAAEARMRSQLARAYAELGQHRQSREEISAAHDAAERSTNPVLGASIREFEGVCAMAAEEFDTAEAAFSDAHTRMRSVGSERGAALSDYYLAKTRIDAGRPAGVLELLLRARLAFERTNDEVNVSRVALRRGEALNLVGETDAAIVALSEAIDAIEALGLRFELAEAYEALSKASADAGRWAAGLRYRRRAYQMYRSLNHPRADVVEIALTGSR